MAVKYSNKPNFAPEKMMSFDKSFSRMNGQPLDPTEVWYDYTALANYAKTAEAYVGQRVTYIDSDGKANNYTIVGEGENSILQPEIPSEYVTETELTNSISGLAEDIPTNISELTNDVGYLTAAVKENGNTTQIPIGCIVFEVSEDGTTLNITTSAAL